MTKIVLDELIAKRSGSVDPSLYPTEKFDLYSISAVDEGRPELRSGNEIGSSKQIVEPGDVLLSKIIPHIRRAWVVGRDNGRRLIASGEWIVFRGTSFFPDYLRHFLISDWFHARFMQTVSGVGGSLLRARPAEVARIEIPLPPLQEQKRIAAILDKADAIRRKRQEALRLTDELLRSVFLDMFGDPVKASWDMETVDHLAASKQGSIRTGPFGSQLLHSEFVNSGICVLGIDNVVQNRFRWARPRFITEEKYQELKRYTVRPGDVLISIMGTCGRCAIVPDDIPIAINTKHLCCITLDRKKCLPEFLHAYFLIHPIARGYLAKTAKGAIMDGLNMGIIKNLPAPTAPLDLQAEFKNVVLKAERNRERILKHESGARWLFSCLQQRAFGGKL
jgi:type I restriction enzyme S subunit